MRTLPGFLLLVTAGCGADPLAAGQIVVTAYGEAFIEDTIPADAFADGWSVTFTRFEVDVGEITAATEPDAEPLAAPSFVRIDLAAPSGGDGHLVATLAAPGGVYDQLGYVLRDVTVEGTATDGAAAVTFAWEVSTTIEHGRCGARTVDGGATPAMITVHGDHLFHDDAIAAEPELAFETIAGADGADGSVADGAITAAELAAVDLATLERYQVGSLDIENLWQFVAHQVTTIGHIDGEGHCEEVVVRR